MISWPELSQKPAIKTRTSTIDPTQRDQMQNGAEATALLWSRGRRQWDVSIDVLTLDDVTALESFVRGDAAYGSEPFLFTDGSDVNNPVTLTVRFSTLPSYTAVAADPGIRKNCSFQLREI